MLPARTSTPSRSVEAAAIAQAHRLYGELTGQSLRLAFDRERMWYELLRAGYGLEEVRAVITCLQCEIRAGRRDVGALQLSNLLQPDRFEEDLQFSRVRLRAAPPVKPSPSPSPPLRSAQQEQGRQRALACLRQLKAALRQTSPPQA
jgi:hypothetical protein